MKKENVFRRATLRCFHYKTGGMVPKQHEAGMVWVKTLLAVCVVVAGLFILGRSLFPLFVFFPQKEVVTTPEALGLPYEEVRITTSDGERIAGWFVPSSKDGGQTLLFLHGNGGNIGDRLESLAIFHDLGLSVLLIDYRGYGQSSGKPSVRGTIIDARAAWDWLLQEKKIAQEDIIIFGRSLGGGVAAALAVEVKPHALILESTFTSLYDVACRLYHWVPKWIVAEDYTTLRNLATLRVPLLVVHSPDDTLIDISMGQAIYDAYSGPKRFLRIRGSHNSGYLDDAKNYINGLRLFLGKEK